MMLRSLVRDMIFRVTATGTGSSLMFELTGFGIGGAGRTLLIVSLRADLPPFLLLPRVYLRADYKCVHDYEQHYHGKRNYLDLIQLREMLNLHACSQIHKPRSHNPQEP